MYKAKTITSLKLKHLKKLSQNTTYDKAMKMDLYKVKGKLPHTYSEVRGAPLLFILFILHTMFKLHIKYRKEEKISFGDRKSSYCRL